MPTAWDDLTLCTVTDVEEEVRELAIPLQGASDDDTETIIATKIRLAKEMMQWELLDRLPQMYVNRNGRYWNYADFTRWYYGEYGYSYTQLDTILDTIENPEVLKRAAVARAIVLAVNDGLLRDNAVYQRNNDLLAFLSKQWQEEYTRRIDTAVRLLKLDLNGDGTIDDDERPRSKGGILWRT